MGDWALSDGQRYEADAQDPTVTSLISITSSGSTHTKGSWTQLLATSAFDAQGLYLHFANANDALFFVDIGVGAAAAEQVLVPDIMVQPPPGGVINGGVFIPVMVPAGTRLSARAQANLATQAIRVGVWPMGTGFGGPVGSGRMTAYGVTAGTTRGTEINGGAVAHTKGSYAEISSSTTNRIRALILAVGFQSKASGLSTRWLIDIAVGAGGSEQIVIPNLYAGTEATYDDFPQKFYGPFPIHIPAATRLAARCQCSETGATERTLDVAVYGID